METSEKESFVSNILIASITLLFAIKKNYFVYYKPRATILIIAFASMYAFSATDHIVELLVIIFFFVCFLEVVDRLLWKYPPFSWMFTTEDFSGTYKGTQISTRLVRIGKVANTNNVICKQFDKSLNLEMVIHQTGSKIIIHSFYYDADGRKSSKSESDKVMISKGKDGKHFTLSYHYGNIGVLKKGGHHGTTILKFIKLPRTIKIEGGYYTNRAQQTRGEFKDLARESKQTIHPF
ncbi:hypothetical protein IMCC3317_20590 [Kordia antarctica]|uniref:SMODS-associating 2TM beta-strand rich effector domain-containing protein n=2 Tax=Kordia antarctica TaxID=1218801 RepID=A0A7L4ZL87_9FLAO|nr:hypothetical protein IMCC3317_20590 [Kordia antarctica]